jgi:hypothetical protein
MNKPVFPRRRAARFTVVLALVLFASSIFWSYRVRADEEAAQYVPLRVGPELLPAGTAIHAVIQNGIAASAAAGDVVAALVSTPIVLHDRLVIPSSVQLKGNLEKISVSGSTVKAEIDFTLLLTPDRRYAIKTRPVVVDTPTRSDAQIFASELKVIMGASLGAMMGAASGNRELVGPGLIRGAIATGPVESAVPVTVILIRELKI